MAVKLLARVLRVIVLQARRVKKEKRRKDEQTGVCVCSCWTYLVDSSELEILICGLGEWELVSMVCPHRRYQTYQCFK